MGRNRGKLRLELITDVKTRRKVYDTRIKFLAKKASKLSALSGVDVCMIHYPPRSETPSENGATVWPENDAERVRGMIASYKGAAEGTVTCNNLASFFEDEAEKVEEEIKNVRRKREGEAAEAKHPATWDERCDGCSVEELRSLERVLTERIERARASMIRMIQERHNQVGSPTGYVPVISDDVKNYWSADIGSDFPISIDGGEAEKYGLGSDHEQQMFDLINSNTFHE